MGAATTHELKIAIIARSEIQARATDCRTSHSSTLRVRVAGTGRVRDARSEQTCSAQPLTAVIPVSRRTPLGGGDGLRLDWQGELEQCPGPAVGGNSQLPPMMLDNHPRDGETEAHTLRLRGYERIKYVRHAFLVDAKSGVLD